MSNRRLILPLVLICLALLIAVSSALFFPHPNEIVVTIDRSVLETTKKTEVSPVTQAPANESGTSHSLALSPVPDPHLVEKTPLGILPRKADNGVRPADAYARKFDPMRLQSDKPKLALVILRAGISETITTEAYLALPPDVTFSVSAYAHDGERQIRDIRNRGHEVFLEIQSATDMHVAEDRGPYAIDPRLDVDANRERLLWLMSRFTGYAGVLADLTPNAKKSDVVKALVSDNIIPRGLFFLSLVRSDSQALAENRDVGTQDQLSLLQAPGQRPTELISALDHAKAGFKRGGRYIIALDPGPLAIGALKDWIVMHQSNAFDLVPLSALMHGMEQM